MEDTIYTRQQYWGNYDQKEAEVGNVMPTSASPGGKPDKGAKSVIPKTASAAGLSEGVEADAVKGEQPEANPQAKPINPRVVVEGKEPPKLIKEKQASRFAMPSLHRYPIDTFDQVRQASAYFEEYKGQFLPEQRREYCDNLTKRASALGIPMPEAVREYSGTGYASRAELDVAIASRAQFVEGDMREVLNKLASVRMTLEPEDFALALTGFDKLAGLDQHYDRDIPDPYMYLFKKEAEEDPDASFVIGNDIVSGCQLKNLATTDCATLKSRFGESFVKEFKNDPIGIFKSLPKDQQKILSREANEPVLEG